MQQITFISLASSPAWPVSTASWGRHCAVGGIPCFFPLPKPLNPTTPPFYPAAGSKPSQQDECWLETFVSFIGSSSMSRLWPWPGLLLFFPLSLTGHISKLTGSVITSHHFLKLKQPKQSSYASLQPISSLYFWYPGFHGPCCDVYHHFPSLPVTVRLQVSALFLCKLSFAPGPSHRDHIHLTLKWQHPQPGVSSPVQFSRLVVSNPLRPHELQHSRPPCQSPTPGVHPNSCPLSWWCHPTISSSVVPFSSCPQSSPASGSFQMSQLFISGGQGIDVSASISILPMNTQDWFPLGWTGWISLQSKGLSRAFSNTTVQKHQFFGAQLSL